LLIALDDSSSEVVIEALDALEDVGDASNIADIQPLLLHRDSEVREAAIEAIEWLED
jgi:HEAT repeat protein